MQSRTLHVNEKPRRFVVVWKPLKKAQIGKRCVHCDTCGRVDEMQGTECEGLNDCTLLIFLTFSLAIFLTCSQCCGSRVVKIARQSVNRRKECVEWFLK